MFHLPIEISCDAKSNRKADSSDEGIFYFLEFIVRGLAKDFILKALTIRAHRKY
jgi:hypothetical protein